MANVQQFATWASIAAKIDTFPKLPSGRVNVFLTKAEILAKGGGLVKIENGYSDNSFVALSDVSQYVVEWRYKFYFEPTEINLDYIGTAQNLRLVSTKQKFINNIAQGDPVKVGSSETVFDSWLIFVENSNTIRANMNGETPRSLNYTRTQNESGKTASCMVHQAAGVVSWEYELNITGGQTLNFAGNTSGSQEVRFESYKYKTVNGERTGERQWVSVETGFSSGDDYNSINRDRIGEGILTISVQANGSLSSRSEVDYIRQAESGKEVYYTCNQEAGQAGWNYYFSGSPTSMTFGATGGSQTVNVSSYRRRTVNGSEDGYQEYINYWGSSNAWASVSGDTITVGTNDSTSQRALDVTYTQSGSGKSFSISITQSAAVITTYISCSWDTPSNFNIVAPAITGSSIYTTTYYEALNGQQTYSQHVTPSTVIESNRSATNMYGSIGTSIGTANVRDHEQYGQLVIYVDVYASSPKDNGALQTTLNMFATYTPK